MDQSQDQLDPEIAKEVIALLNKKVVKLRSDNAELQGRLDKYSVKKEDEDHVSLNDGNTERLPEEIANYKAELDRRPRMGEAAMLEEKLKECKKRGQELGNQVHLLDAKLEESESERQNAAAFQEQLEKKIEDLCHILNERTEENQKLVAQLELLANVFDFCKFLDGQLISLPPRRPPALMTRCERRRFSHLVLQRGEKYFTPNVPGSIIWAGENGGCVVPLPSVIYNGSTQASEQYHNKPVVNHLYQFLDVNELTDHRKYHGTYRCVAVVRADWACLESIDSGVSGCFLGHLVLGRGLAQQTTVSFIKQLYKTGALKVDYIVLRYENFDDALMEQVRPTDGPPTIVDVPSPLTGDKRPSDQYQEWADGSVKKPRLQN